MIFNIFNVPKEINKVDYLKFLNKLNLENYKFTMDCVKEVTSVLNYEEILDFIMEIGINRLSEILIKIIIDRNTDIYHISSYLENNKNSKFKKNFYDIVPEIIYFFNLKYKEKDEKEKNIEKEEYINGHRNQRDCLLCLDNNIPMNLYPDNYKKDLIEKTINNLDKISLDEKQNLEIKKEILNKKIYQYNNQNPKNQKEITCILTDETVKKLSQIEIAIKANIPIIIQGFTSAGKSFLSIVASKINKRECLSTALSEHTTIENLLGRDVIKSDNSIKFVPGILLLAYKDGKTLILDECDLAKPEVLSYILGSMTKNELIICNQTFRLTMNGEVKGFNEKQRNILSSNILSKFNLIQFDEMKKEECKEIFKSLLEQEQNHQNYINNIDIFIEIHQKMMNYMKENNKSIDPIVTLRNLKHFCYLNRNNIHPRIAAEISYTSRFPKNEKKDFDDILNKLGVYQENEEIKLIIEKNIKDNFLFYNDTYKKVIHLALTTVEAGLHPLLIGEKESGLSTLAKLIASIISKDFEFLFCSSETSVEDLIGCYQPEIKNKDKIEKLSSYIQWNDGPVIRAGKNGVPLILDNINFSKPQVIECLNPLLEENSKYNNVEYNILEKENECPKQIKSGFNIIGTMNLNKENKNTISKSLMNRFVAIYVDNDIEINNQNLNIIIENSCKKLDKQIKETNSILINDKDNDINDNNDDDVFGGREGKEDDKKNKIKEEKNEIPEWYNIRGISNKTLKEIKQCIKEENIEGKNMKSIIKMI